MLDKFKQVTDSFFVSPQIDMSDIDAAKEMGVKLIVNNRPDGEERGQPTGAEIEAAAKSAGMGYAYIPVDIKGITPNHTNALENAMDDFPDGKILAYCKSGTRSVLVFAYGEARFGKPVDQIIEEARAAGYDISGHEPALTLLHDAHKAPHRDSPI
ncbi:MAG: TIGR01244 family phosphatase [Marinicaulis sp.]|nr:TIGR01244 family phosphatase [Marinicaulis sp.]NNE41977.1 TIGR01244 family phosphatase [Marinicaulis sp.]NNL88176.1 TIGR01244 family phosphatase [Marinicaulis sp.]